ncbi:MAG: BrnT family toxin [Desulfosarcina sp.]|nr:BrnT family toxin [Desulfobacterales bacterium]
MWNDTHRVEILTSYPLENRSILIGKINKKLWTAIFTMRGNAIRIISVRRVRKKETELYGENKNSRKHKRV